MFSVDKQASTGHLIKTCSYKNLISLYIDKHLAKVEEQRVKNHLKTCKNCKHRASSLQKAYGFLAESIPKKKISDESLEEISMEIAGLYELVKEQNSKKINFKAFANDLRAVIFSSLSLKAYLLFAVAIYTFRLLKI